MSSKPGSGRNTLGQSGFVGFRRRFEDEELDAKKPGIDRLGSVGNASPEGLAAADGLIVPVMNEGGKFLSSFEGTKVMIDDEIENRAFPEPGTPEWLEDYGWWKPSPYELEDFFKLHKHLEKGFESRVDFKQGGEDAKQFKHELLARLYSLTDCSRFIADDILDVVKKRYDRDPPAEK